MAIAVYDSVMAIKGGYKPFAVDVDAPKGASAEAAVAAAAHRILVHYLPAQAATILDPAYTASLAAIPAGQAKTSGIAVGEGVAQLLIAQRAGDGFRAPVTYTPPNPPIPGIWLPTAPSPPIGPYLGLVKPFSLKSADQFRPDGPPALGSAKWARDYNEVKEIGSSTSTTRTAEQTLAARFWGEAPVQQARGSFRKFVVDRKLDVVQASRFMAMVSVVYADALIACFDAKYHYRVLAADHRDPGGRHGRQRRDRGRPHVDDAAPRHAQPSGVPERALLHHAGRRLRDRQVPGDEEDRLHRPEPDRSRRPLVRAVRRTCRTRSRTPASGAASTTARPSRTGSRSAGRPSTRCCSTTSRRRRTRDMAAAERPGRAAPPRRSALDAGAAELRQRSRAAVDAELRVHVLEVLAHGRRRDREQPRRLRGRLPGRNAPQHVALARRQRDRRRRFLGEEEGLVARRLDDKTSAVADQLERRPRRLGTQPVGDLCREAASVEPAEPLIDEPAGRQ